MSSVDRRYITTLAVADSLRRLLSANTPPGTAMLFACGSAVAKTFQHVSELLKDRSPELPFFSLEEVGFHDNYDDCWIILFDKIYNVTDFIHLHPGGETVILEHAGRDATFTFLSAGHADHMMTVLNSYLVGRLPSSEHIFQVEKTTTE